MEEFEAAIEAVGALEEGLRRDMYLYIRSRREPVGREEAAEAVGISRKLAAFHLDKLVEKGLLKASYSRLSGRSGPGAGHPAKVYEPTGVEVAVSLPSRSYEFVGHVLLDAITGSPGSVNESVRASARKEGLLLGQQIKKQADDRVADPLALEQEVLYNRGYEPYLNDDGDLRVANCPYRKLAQQSREVVCNLNHAFIEGLLEGLEDDELKAVLDPKPGECCVRVETAGAAG